MYRLLVSTCVHTHYTRSHIPFQSFPYISYDHHTFHIGDAYENQEKSVCERGSELGSIRNNPGCSPVCEFNPWGLDVYIQPGGRELDLTWQPGG